MFRKICSSFTHNLSFLQSYQELRFVNEKYLMKYYKLSERYGCLKTQDMRTIKSAVAATLLKMQHLLLICNYILCPEKSLSSLMDFNLAIRIRHPVEIGSNDMTNCTHFFTY
jgi:hypothetical protein